jgi:hypothetical protein
MTAHCVLGRDGLVHIQYANLGNPNVGTFSQPEPKITPIIGGNKGRESRHSKVNSYWWETYFAAKSWKQYRKNQVRGLDVRESHRYMEDKLTEESIN